MGYDYKENVYIRSLFMGGATVMGIRLRPFSCHHAAAFMMFNLPYLSADRSPTTQDLITALLICKDSYADSLKSLDLFTRSPVYRAWFMARLVLRSTYRGQCDFLDYCKALTETPDFWREKNTPSSNSGIPWPFKFAACLWEYFTDTREEAWDMPISLAACYCSQVAEENGAKIKDPVEIEKARVAIEEFNNARN